MKIKVELTGIRNAAFYSVAVGSVVELELEEYLRGVVAAEIGNASLEACKAQALASRTTAYPYYSAGKVISDSSRSAQCFNAKRAHSTKYPNAFQAVSETADEVLKYDGKVIVPCSFSSSNGGRTTSSQERWGGARAWLIAQKDEEFHKVIYMATKNPKLDMLLNNLREQMYRYRFEYIKDANMREDLRREHREITDAIIKGECERAKAAISLHIDNQEENILKNL